MCMRKWGYMSKIHHIETIMYGIAMGILMVNHQNQKSLLKVRNKGSAMVLTKWIGFIHGDDDDDKDKVLRRSMSNLSANFRQRSRAATLH